MAKDKQADPLVLAQEAADREAGERHVFYHPGYKCNGVAAGGGVFEPNAPPAGFEYDEEAWIKGGKKGPAKLKKLVLAAPQEVKPTSG